MSSLLVDGRYRLATRPAGADPGWWPARDERLRRDVVVRILGTEVAPGPATRAQLAALANLSNPGLVGVLDAGDDLTIAGDARVYLVHEPVSAPALHTVLAAGLDDASTVPAIGASVAATLAYLHAQGLAHGSLRTDTVLVLSDDPYRSGPPPRRTTRLLDCGVARLCGYRTPTSQDDLRALGDLLWSAAHAVPAASADEGQRAVLAAVRELALRLLRGAEDLDAATVSGELAALAAAAPMEPVRRPRGRHRRARR